MIQIQISDRQVNQALTRLVASVSNPRTVLDEIGELLIDSTKARFATSTGPDGKRWAENSDITILQYLGRYKGSFKKNGGLSAKGASRLGGKKPLIGESGSLSSQIFKKVEGNNTLYIGSTMIYAAAQQFGIKKGYAGSNKRGSPIPWGDIPARPFLGISNEDRGMILDTISDYLTQNFKP